MRSASATVLLLVTTIFGGRGLARAEAGPSPPTDAGAAADASLPDGEMTGGDGGKPDATATTASPPPPGGGTTGLLDPGPPPDRAAPSPVPAGYTVTGYLRADTFVGKVPGYATGEAKAAYGELSLALKTPKERHGDGFAEVRLRHGLQGAEQQTFLDLREAYANAYLGPLDLRLGKQIIVWGRADALNPTNNLTPFDLRIRSPIEDDRRTGNVGARAFLNFSPLRLEGVWMPLYAPSTLPAVGLPAFVTFGGPVFPPPELQNGLLAGRVHLELPAFELSVSYLHGGAPLPGLTLTGLTFDPDNPAVRVSRTAYTHHVVGFDFSTALGDVLALRAEAAYRRPVEHQNRPYTPRPDLQYVVGVDRAFGPLNVIAQYLGRTVFDWQKRNGPETPLDPAVLRNMRTDFLEGAATMGINQELARTNQILFQQTARVQHLITVRLEWLAAHDTLTLSALGLVNVTTREWLVAPRLGWRISDRLTATLGAEIFQGPQGTLFGLIDELLSAGYTELRVVF